MWSYTVVSLFVVFSMSTVIRRPLRYHEVFVPSRPKQLPPPIINVTEGLNIHFKRLGWIRSLEYCRRKNQILATIPSKTVIKELLKSYVPYDLRNWKDGFWIGAYDLGHEDKFFWLSTGRTVNAYTNWRPGEPNNGRGDENCVTMFVNGKWGDEQCLKKRAFICEDLPTVS